MSKILIITDDAHLRDLLGTLLRHGGFKTDDAADGAEALLSLVIMEPDMVVFDMMMADLDAWRMCREIRDHFRLPVLMLSADKETSRTIGSFQPGTDNCLAIPFEPRELLGKVQALLERSRNTSFQTLRIRELLMDRKTRQVTNGGYKAILPRKEFEILFSLASHAGRTLLREQLIADVWHDGFPGNGRTLDVHISRIRKLFPEDRSSFRIRSVRGLGYRMEAKQTAVVAARPDHGADCG